MRIHFKVALAAVLVLGAGAGAVHGASASQLLVVCSPGSPGTTADAQARMDTFATALAGKTGTTITAVYEPSDAGGVKRIANAGIAIVSLPFFLEHEKQLGLHARLQVVQDKRPALDQWALVAQRGRIKSADALAGFTIVSGAAYAPGFVRGSALGKFGKLPANVKLAQSTAVLSALRRAADGEPIAVLLDGTQAASLASLGFASKLEVVTRSPPMPPGLVVTVDSRMPANSWGPLEAALLAFSTDRSGAAALGALQLERFAPIDNDALAAARQAYVSAP